MQKLTKDWIRKAEDDLAIAQQSTQSSLRLYDGICFHCQQCAEKYLKALLQELGVVVPRLHDLDRLRGLLQADYPELRRLRRGLEFLTNFAVETRYPGQNAKKRQAVSALRWAERIRREARLLLGLRQ